jgi:hypothetical protein
MVTIQLMGLPKEIHKSVKQLEKTFKIINISQE